MVETPADSATPLARAYPDLMPPPKALPALPVVPAGTARRLLLGGQGLFADPARAASPAAVGREIARLGFVQIDTINVLDRAHHHILRTRFDAYEPRMLAKLLERDRTCFEHWTHDAAIIPIRWFPWWRRRFDAYRRRGHSSNAWWRWRMGEHADELIRHVLRRIEREGPLMTRDFAHPAGRSGAWWAWKPQKTTLEYLWRAGRLAVAGRRNFHKVYDLTRRVFPGRVDGPLPGRREHVGWACTAALERLGVATPGELAGFLDAVGIADATAWCRRATRHGAAVPVLVEAADGSRPRQAVAAPDWRRRAGRRPRDANRLRLLNPFDPVLRDRRRTQRLFGFDYRFEAFVPAPRRRYGYYVLPILEGERFVGRLDAKLHRDRGVLEVKGLWWEPGVRTTTARRAGLDEALTRLANGLGADRVRRTAPRTRG